MKIIVCGSRDWTNYPLILRVLNEFREQFVGRSLTIVHGGAKGADTRAGRAATELGIPCEVVLANWKQHARGAGPIRNKAMLDLKPGLVIAFKENFDFSYRQGGTEHMVKIAREAGVTCLVYTREDTQRVVLG